MITNNLLKIKVSGLLYENRIPKNTPSHLNLLAKFTCQILDYSLRMPRIILFHFCCIYSKVISYKDVVKQEFASRKLLIVNLSVKLPLREKCPNSEFFLVRIFLHSG